MWGIIPEGRAYGPGSGNPANAFVLLSMSPTALRSMPRSGEWMQKLKVTLGIVELGLVLKFVSNVDLGLRFFLIGRELFLALWAVSFLVAAAYLFGITKAFASAERWSLGPKQGIFAALFLALTLYLGSGIDGTPLAQTVEAFLPVLQADHLQAFRDVAEEDFEEGVKLATKLGAPIFLDFTGFQ
jgi:thiol:disulfide interchange protein DsbD